MQNKVEWSLIKILVALVLCLLSFLVSAKECKSISPELIGKNSKLVNNILLKADQIDKEVEIVDVISECGLDSSDKFIVGISWAGRDGGAIALINKEGNIFDLQQIGYIHSWQWIILNGDKVLLISSKVGGGSGSLDEKYNFITINGDKISIDLKLSKKLGSFPMGVSPDDNYQVDGFVQFDFDNRSFRYLAVTTKFLIDKNGSLVVDNRSQDTVCYKAIKKNNATLFDKSKCE